METSKNINSTVCFNRNRSHVQIDLSAEILKVHDARFFKEKTVRKQHNPVACTSFLFLSKLAHRPAVHIDGD